MHLHGLTKADEPEKRFALMMVPNPTDPYEGSSNSDLTPYTLKVVLQLFPSIAKFPALHEYSDFQPLPKRPEEEISPVKAKPLETTPAKYHRKNSAK